MTKGRFISIDGTDGSGKATQTRMLVDRLRREGHEVMTISFPVYDSTTGLFVGAYLGKRNCAIGLVERMFPGIDSKVIDTLRNQKEVRSPFSEGAVGLDPRVASLYFAANRLHHALDISQAIKLGQYVVTDRYVRANQGHQGGKIENSLERAKFYSWLEDLEHGLLSLPRPDVDLLLHVPTEVAIQLRKGRAGEADEHERDGNHLRLAERAYLQLAEIYDLKVIECVREGKMRKVEDIHEEIFEAVKNS
jgi:dTMP kinase